MKLYQFFYYVPESHLEVTKEAIFQAGAGKVGNYTKCSWETQGSGQFLPEIGSNPFIGKVGQVEKVVEYRVETVCNKDSLQKVIAALKKAHTYETPAFGVIELLC